MGRKTSRKVSTLVSTLIRNEDAADGEILETPAVSALAGATKRHDGSDDDDSDDEDAEDEEAELERRLVEEKLAEEESAKNERENRGIYNGEALKKLVEDYARSTSKLAWVETLDTCEYPLDLVNVNDDLKREVAFYNNTLASVRFAKDKLKQQGIAYKRPEDYFAEMLKTDSHMAKVKDKLIYEQKKIQAVEDRKKSQAHRKVAKELQAEKAKERLQQKKDTLDAVKEWKKRRNQDKGGAIHDDDDRELDDIVSGKTAVVPTGKRKRDDSRGVDPKKPKTNFKREAKDKKFGFGGPKKHVKSNTRESTHDMSAFPGRKQRAAGGGGRGGGRGGAGGRGGGRGGASGGRSGGRDAGGRSANGGERSSAGKAPKAKRQGKTTRTKQQRGGKR